MALTVAVTKKSVTTSQDGLYQITLNLQYLNGTAVLIDQDFSENYWVGQTPAFVIAKFKEKMQKAIDDYKAAQVIFNSATLDTAITNLKNGLGV
jgi:hypothetical protein